MVATPIGNLEDITIRAIKILFSVPVIACEDTRHTGQLLKILENLYRPEIFNFQFSIFKPKKYISIRDFNEQQVVQKIIIELQTSDVALVSDAGTPLISDPGFKLVRACQEAGIKVCPIPGPNAGITALSASGLPTNKFLFLGFLPKKWEIRPEETTIIYESPMRIQKTITEIRSRYPKSRIVLAHELTKIHERIWELGFENWDLQIPHKGEFVILVYREADSGQSYPQG